MEKPSTERSYEQCGHYSTAMRARRVIAEEDAIDGARYDLEEQALRLIARQNPLAIDLRIISTIMGLASELERIGDYAEGIAEIALRLATLPPIAIPVVVEDMASRALCCGHRSPP